MVIICFIHYSHRVLSPLQKLPTRSPLPLIVTVFIVRQRQLQMTENENSSQIINSVKHRRQTFVKKKMKVGHKMHHVTNFTGTQMNNFPCCSTLVPLAVP